MGPSVSKDSGIKVWVWAIDWYFSSSGLLCTQRRLQRLMTCQVYSTHAARFRWLWRHRSYSYPPTCHEICVNQPRRLPFDLRKRTSSLTTGTLALAIQPWHEVGRSRRGGELFCQHCVVCMRDRECLLGRPWRPMDTDWAHNARIPDVVPPQLWQLRHPDADHEMKMGSAWRQSVKCRHC